MKLDKFPTVQNAVRFYDPDPQVVRRKFVAFAKSKPPFSYNDLRKLIRQSYGLHQDLPTLENTIRLGVLRAYVREKYLEILPLLRQYIDQQKPTYVQSLGHSLTYPAGRGLFVTVDPPFVIGTSIGAVIPWISFWKHNPLTPTQMALLCAMIRSVLQQEADLDGAVLQFVDLSVPKGATDRILRVQDLRSVESLGNAQVTSMLETLHTGMELAEGDLAGLPQSDSTPSPQSDTDSNQLKLL